jgi:hypothetical protein
MIEPDLSHLEREVEAARVKLASDLSLLRSPLAASDFKESLRLEAIDRKDALVAKAKTSVQSWIESLIEDVKARAAANPAAALAIGAGIAWRLIRYPPVATTLVGAGLVSLFRTSPAHLYDADYLSHAKTRLAEQASEAADLAKDKAAVLAHTVTEKVTKTTDELRESAQDLAGQTASAAHELGHEVKQRASAMWSDTTGPLDQAGHTVHSIAPTVATRDQMLLGAAGVAVVAALGIACQRRIAEAETG